VQQGPLSNLKMEISMQPDGSELPFLESNDPDEVDLNQFRMYSALK
jgi:hypothetical protein